MNDQNMYKERQKERKKEIKEKNEKDYTQTRLDMQIIQIFDYLKRPSISEDIFQYRVIQMHEGA